MAIQSFQLDPSGFSGTLDDIPDGASYVRMSTSEASKLAGIEDGAEANPSDDEIVASINSATDPITRASALDQNSLNIVKTNPTVGEFYVKNIHRTSDGKLDIEYDDVAKS
jgi:hypothetical protein